MIKQFDIYNPYINTVVTSHYIGIIEEALHLLGVETTSLSKLKYAKENHAKGVLVISPLDVGMAKRRGYRTVFCWAQGIIPEESYMRNHSRLRYHALSCLEKRGIIRADYLFVVSNGMKKHYQEKYNIKKANSFLMPCFNEELTADRVFEEKDLSFVYAGGLDEWQCFRQTVELFVKIQKAIPPCKFYVFVKEKDMAEHILRDYHVENYEIGYYPPNELKEKLKKIKFGFCIREKDPINYVSTPTKLSTYVCNGIIPIVSSSVNDFAEISKNSKFTVVVDEDSAAIKKVRSIVESKISPEELLEDFSQCYGQYYNRAQYIQKIKSEIEPVLY